MGRSIGSRIGVYEILGSLGAGGMGEVYRGRDTKLGGHIEAIYGFEDAGDVPSLVIELVEGDTLEARLRRGPLPLARGVGGCPTDR